MVFPGNVVPLHADGLLHFYISITRGPGSVLAETVQRYHGGIQLAQERRCGLQDNAHAHMRVFKFWPVKIGGKCKFCLSSFPVPAGPRKRRVLEANLLDDGR